MQNYLVFICRSQKQEYKTVIASDQQQSSSETCEDANYLQPLSTECILTGLPLTYKNFALVMKNDEDL